MLTCPKCGVELPLGTSADACPNCIFSFAAEPETIVVLHGNKDSMVPCTARQFGDYQLLDEIARGGMGIVYRARQVSLNRVVAVKMILAGQFAGKEIAQRFKSEAGAAAVLQHPNIVAVHEVGVHAGQHFFSMDYVEGETLTQLVGHQPLPPRKAARYVKVVAEAIDYAHKQGILHRDLKPSNVLIDAATDQPRVTDFGLARRLDEASSITVTGQVLGSPNFMPPEQASGQRGKLGRHSDVYGLGGILFYALTARAPFQGATLEATIHEVLNSESISPRALNPGVPHDLETICLKCLEKEPSRRYQTAQELAEELRRYLSDEPIHARPVSRAERAWRWCRRKPALAGSLAAGGVLLLILAIGSPVAALRISRAATALRLNLYVADMNNASSALQQRQFGRAKELLERYRWPARGQEDLRGIEWHFLWEQCQPDFDFSFAPHADAINCAVFSPDGKWLATAGRDRTVQVWDLKSRQRIRTLTGFDGFIDLKALAFSPDSRLLVAKGGHRLRGWRVGEWVEIGVPLSAVPNETVNNAVAFSCDGLTLATRIPGGVGFVDVGNWQTNGVFLPDTNHYADGQLCLGTVLTYSPDGQFLLVSDWHELVIRDARAPLRTVATLMRQDGNRKMRIMAIALSQTHLAAGFRDGIVTLWDRKDWRELASFQAQPSLIYDLVFSPDGSLLLACGDEHAIQVWRVEELASGAVSRVPDATFLRGHAGAVNSLMFAHDGHMLLSSSSDRTAKLWDVSVPRGQRSLAASSRPIWFSPDGRKLLMAHTNSQLHWWDVSQRVDLGPTDPPLSAARVRAVSPDGKLVIVVPQTNQLEVRDFHSGKVLRNFEVPGSTFRRASFAARRPECRLAFATVEGAGVTYWVWNVNSGQQPVCVGAGLGTIGTGLGIDGVFAFSRDGNVLAHAAKGGILLHSLAKNQSRLLPAVDEDIVALAISWDGGVLAAAKGLDPTIRTWEIKSGRELSPLTQTYLSAAVLEFSPDGKSLITCTWDGDIQFWNLALRKELAALPTRHPMQCFMLLSPDGSALACPAPKAFAERGYVNVWRAPTLAKIEREQKTETRK